MNSSPTQYVDTVDNVMWFIAGSSVLLLLGITAAMIYFVFKYNRKKGHKPVDIHGNIWLEIIWIAIPTILVLVMFYYGYVGYSQIRIIPDDAMVVKVTAKMWEWDFEYQNGKKTDTLYVPVNQAVKLELRSIDVNHSLYIPAFRIKEDVIYGKENYLGFTADKPGKYEIACAEYCGLNHSMMYTAVVVMPRDKYDIWYNTIKKNASETSEKDSLKTE